MSTRNPVMNAVRLLRPDNPAWESYLALVDHDFFHTSKYHDLSESNDEGEGWLAVYGDAERFVAWPYLLQEIPEFTNCKRRLYDITSTYGYAGPLVYRCAEDEDFLACAWAALTAAWRRQGGISIFTRFHPIWSSGAWITSSCMRMNRSDTLGGPCAQGHIIAIDLTQSSEELWNGYRPNLRYSLRRCEKDGFTSVADPGWANLDDFIQLYYRTMQRNQAASFYYFSEEYFHNFQKKLGAHGQLIITRRNNDIAAAAVVIEYNDIVHVHLLASDERFSRLSPSKLTIHDAALWAKSRGNRLLVLGGGRQSKDDSLFDFKRKFSATMFPFYTGRWILDHETYASLASEWRKRAHSFWPDERLTGYFPVYRAPFDQPNLVTKR